MASTSGYSPLSTFSPRIPHSSRRTLLTHQQQLITFPIILAIYRSYIHPLHIYPGPKLHALTNLTQIHYVLRGTWVRKVLALHEQYGPIVRVAPDEISYAVPEAWDDIYKVGNKEGQLGKAMPYVNQKIQPKDVSRSVHLGGCLVPLFIVWDADDDSPS
jgi:hypothetical protein